MSLRLILRHYRPGSEDWSWPAEFADMIESDPEKCVALLRSVADQGFREPLPDEDPVMLGNDGRVWSGHHRIMVAWLCDLSDIPCAFGTGG